jgi:hypothetical protein
LQANQLHLNPLLFAATNTSGVMGKMISPHNICTGLTVTDLKGHAGLVFPRTFPHSTERTVSLGSSSRSSDTWFRGSFSIGATVLATRGSGWPHRHP